MEIKEKIERWKVLAELWFNEGSKIFLKDLNNNWYWANIIIVGEDTLLIDCFAPTERVGHQKLYWAEISYFDKYREEGK